jgi:hypothetical protein
VNPIVFLQEGGQASSGGLSPQTIIMGAAGALATMITAAIGYFGSRRKTASEITISERDSLLTASQALREEMRKELSRLYTRIGELEGELRSERAERQTDTDRYEERVRRLEVQLYRLRRHNTLMRAVIMDHDLELPEMLSDDEEPTPTSQSKTA